MESYGELLKNARQAKKLTLDAVSRETSISREFLEALENENSGAFNGEAYLVGFLRNYAEYLELDSNKLISLYRNMMIQQSPVPEGLIEKPKPTYFVPVFIGGIAAVILSVILILYFAVYRRKLIEKENSYAVSEKIQEKTYELTDKPMNTRVYVGDSIIVPVKEDKIKLEVVSDTNSKLGLKGDTIGVQYFELSETRELDVDGDATIDFVLDVWEISSNDQSRGAEVYIVKKTDSAVSSIADNSIIQSTQKQNANYNLILEDVRPYPFTMNASFRKPCVFRYEVDRKNSKEGYYSNGDVVTLTANNRIRLWISNGNTVKFQVIASSQTYELEIGKAGECIVQDIKWILSDDGKYCLVVEQID